MCLQIYRNTYTRVQSSEIAGGAAYSLLSRVLYSEMESCR